MKSNIENHPRELVVWVNDCAYASKEQIYLLPILWGYCKCYQVPMLLQFLSWKYANDKCHSSNNIAWQEYNWPHWRLQYSTMGMRLKCVACHLKQIERPWQTCAVSLRCVLCCARFWSMIPQRQLLLLYPVSTLTRDTWKIKNASHKTSTTPLAIPLPRLCFILLERMSRTRAED